MSVANAARRGARHETAADEAASVRKRRRPSLGVALLALLATLGFFVPAVVNDQYQLTLVVDGLSLGLVALSIGFLVTELGIFSFGASAFYAISAYGFTVAVDTWGLPVAVAALFGFVLSVAVAAVVGAVFVRVGGLSFAMVTLAFASLLMQVVSLSDFRRVLGGDAGLVATPHGSLLGITSASLLTPNGVWPLAWGAVLICMGSTTLVRRSHFGRVLHGVRENETRMKYCGFDTYWPKVGAFVIASAMAAVGGLLQVIFHGFASPSMFGFGFAGNGIVAGLVGGLWSVWGTLLGGLIFTHGQSWLSTSGNLSLYMGLATVLVVLFLRRGVAGLGRQLVEWCRRRYAHGRKDA